MKNDYSSPTKLSSMRLCSDDLKNNSDFKPNIVHQDIPLTANYEKMQNEFFLIQEKIRILEEKLTKNIGPLLSGGLIKVR